MRAIALLSFWKLRNSLRNLFSDPRKLLPLLFFVLMMCFSVGSALFGISQGPSKSNSMLSVANVHVAVTAILMALSVFCIDTGLGEGLLAFPMSDVDYLFPSPISRRTVLAYRLPALTFSILFFAGLSIYFIKMASNFGPPPPATGGPAPTGTIPFAIILCGAIWMNLAMFLSVHLADRKGIRRIEGFVVLAVIVALGAIGWFRGMDAVGAILHSKPVQLLFLPTTLAADAVVASNTHQPTGPVLGWLLLIYAFSLIPMFLSRSNWYEQSIVSSERISAMRVAAKSGYAGLAAFQASKHKHRSTKEYTVKPFGQGGMALFWAHLCAAAKRPWPNFILPGLTALGVGIAGAMMNFKDPPSGSGLQAAMLMYSTIFLMGSAKTASEAAVRRRDVLSPLPIGGWQSVAANLGVPMLSAMTIALTALFVYVVSVGPYWPEVLYGVLIVFPLRLASRMALQYSLVLGYPDLADKVQQFLGQMIYYAFAAPLLIAEVVLCLPAIFLKSAWVGLIVLTGFEAFLTVALFKLAGVISERAVATGEPVSLWKVVRKRA